MCSQIHLCKFLHLKKTYSIFNAQLLLPNQETFPRQEQVRIWSTPFICAYKINKEVEESRVLQMQTNHLLAPDAYHLSPMKIVVLTNLTFPPFDKRWGIFFFGSLPGYDSHLPAEHTTRLSGLDKWTIFLSMPKTALSMEHLMGNKVIFVTLKQPLISLKKSEAIKLMQNLLGEAASGVLWSPTPILHIIHPAG